MLMVGIGFWQEIHKQHMPHTKFLIQKDRDEFYNLVDYSSLPSFTSDYMMNLEGRRPHRHIIPITSDDAHATFYLWYLKENQETLNHLLQ